MLSLSRTWYTQCFIHESFKVIISLYENNTNNNNDNYIYSNLQTVFNDLIILSINLTNTMSSKNLENDYNVLINNWIITLITPSIIINN